MTIQADAHYVEQYKSRVTHVYQNRGFLMKGMLQPEGRMEGKKAWWPIHGATAATKKRPRVKATPGNIGKSQISADLQTWETFDYIGKFDMTRQTVNEKEALVQAGALALGRAVDQEIMDMFNAKAATAGTTNFFDHSAAPLALGDLMYDIAKWTGSNKIPIDGMLFGGLRMMDWQMLSGFKQFSSVDWTGPDLPFRQRTPGKTWNFINWVVLPDDYFPVPAANKADLFMWHKPANGWSENMEIDTTFAWDNEMGEWSLRQESEGAAQNLLPESLARIRVKTDVTTIATN
jgi:Phage capsid protein